MSESFPSHCEVGPESLPWPVVPCALAPEQAFELFLQVFSEHTRYTPASEPLAGCSISLEGSLPPGQWGAPPESRVRSHTQLPRLSLLLTCGELLPSLYSESSHRGRGVHVPRSSRPSCASLPTVPSAQPFRFLSCNLAFICYFFVLFFPLWEVGSCEVPGLQLRLTDCCGLSDERHILGMDSASYWRGGGASWGARRAPPTRGAGRSEPAASWGWGPLCLQVRSCKGQEGSNLKAWRAGGRCGCLSLF